MFNRGWKKDRQELQEKLSTQADEISFYKNEITKLQDNLIQIEGRLRVAEEQHGHCRKALEETTKIVFKVDESSRKGFDIYRNAVKGPVSDDSCARTLGQTVKEICNAAREVEAKFMGYHTHVSADEELSRLRYKITLDFNNPLLKDKYNSFVASMGQTLKTRMALTLVAPKVNVIRTGKRVEINLEAKYRGGFSDACAEFYKYLQSEGLILGPEVVDSDSDNRTASYYKNLKE